MPKTKVRPERKKRDEEEDVDKQLKALGLYDADTSFQEKKEFLAAIKESQKDMMQTDEIVPSDEDAFESSSPAECDSESTERVHSDKMLQDITTKDSPPGKAADKETYADKLQSSTNLKDLQVVLHKLENTPSHSSKGGDENEEGEFKTVNRKKLQLRNGKSAHLKTSPTCRSPVPEILPKKAAEISKEELKHMRTRARDLAALLDRVNLPTTPLLYPLKIDDNLVSKDAVKELIASEKGLRVAQLLGKEQVKWKDPVNLTTFTKKMSSHGTQAESSESVRAKSNSPPASSVYDFPELTSKGEQELRTESPVVSSRSWKGAADDDDFQIMIPTERAIEGPSEADDGQCPICRKRFPVKDLEEHASQCNDFLGEGEIIGTRSSRQTRSRQLQDQTSNRTPSARFPTANETSRGTGNDGPKARERGAVFTSIIQADDYDGTTDEIITDDSDLETAGTSSSKRSKKQTNSGASTRGKKRRC